MKPLYIALACTGIGFSQAAPPVNGDAKLMPNHCASNPSLGDITAQPSWNGWGNGTSNSRYQVWRGEAHSRSDVPKLIHEMGLRAFPARRPCQRPADQVVAGRESFWVSTPATYIPSTP